MSDHLTDLDAAYAVDDNMQKEIDKENADPWALQPDRAGFTPIDLTDEDASKGTPLYEEGYRNRWTQDEICEIEDAGLRPLTDRDDREKVVGQIAFISLRCTRGPNEGKRIDKSWWLRDGEPKAVRDMNRDLQKIFGRLQIKPELVALPDGLQAPSYTATLPSLVGRTVKLVIQQKWDFPYRIVGGEWEVQDDQPKKFKKKALDIKSV